MGTSSARQGPSSRFWRTAKRTATLYLSPGAAAPVAAQEVVSRYLAALKESQGEENQDLLGAFRQTRKTAQNLGAFCQNLAAKGWEEVLAEAGLAAVRDQPREVLAATLTAALSEAGSGLEDAIARTSLAATLNFSLPEVTPPADTGETNPALEPAAVVRHFLATALYQRLVLDLGESLEARAAGWRHLEAGLADLQASIIQAATTTAGDSPPPTQWQGLSGWLWVSDTLHRLLQEFPPPVPLPDPGA
jgi:hypothetical protein